MQIQRALILGLALSASVCLQAERTPLKISDIVAWKRIQTPVISNDGKWFAYKLSPLDGDSDLVLTHLPDGKEQRFPLGQIVRPNPYLNPGGPPPEQAGPPRDIVFSEDSKWLVFEKRPSAKEAASLRKLHKPMENQAVLVDLATQKKTEFQRVKRFSFSGETASAIVLHRYGVPPPTPAPPVTGTAKPEEKPQGSDLLVIDLSTNNTLSLGNVSEFAFDKSGKWLAWLVDAQDKLGNGIELRNMITGSVSALDTSPALYKQLAWTEKGDGLAVLRGTEDKVWKDKLYALVAFKDFGNTAPSKFEFDPAKDSSFPKSMTISADRHPAWMANLKEVIFGIKQLIPSDAERAKKGEDPEESPDLVIWHWKDSRLQSQQQVQENRDKTFSYLAAWQPETRKFVRLSDEAVRDVALSPEAKFGVGADVREYELSGNLDGKRYQDLYRLNPETGDRTLILTKARWVFGTSPDGTHLISYKDGGFFSSNLVDGEIHNLTKNVAAVFIDTEDDHNVEKPPAHFIGWSKDSKFVLVSDNWDIWKMPADGGSAVNLTANGKKEGIRYQAIWHLAAEDKGVDLDKPLYIKALGERTKKGGVGLVEPGKTGARMLRWDDAAYANLLMAKNADVFLYSRETTNDYGDYYVAKADLSSGGKVTNADPQQKDFLWTNGTKLVEYAGARGDKLQGVLYLPANYEPGKKYPTIVYIYEKLSQSANSYPAPGLNGFSIGFYTSNGYAVLTPDISYKVNDPGTSSVTCILAALKAAEATGVVDGTRVALHGHSWGGYQTAFAVTQTKAFRAAIAGAPLTDLVSMYSSIYWNTGSTNQPIFESSQGRFTGGYWQETQAYLRNSPVYHAENVHTPLLILHNDKDGAVDHTQGIEYYNTLRRLNKPVVMLEYKGENHGLFQTKNMKDYTVRMKEFFDYYLKDGPAPKWWTEGVPRLKMEEELKSREIQTNTQAAPVPAAVSPTGNF